MPQVLSQALGKSQQHLLCIRGHSSLEQGYVSRVARLMSGKLRAQTSDWHQCSCSGSMRKCAQNKWPLGWGLKHCLASKWAKGAVVVVMDRVEGASVSGGQCREARPEEKQEGKGGVMRGRGVGCWGAICASGLGSKMREWSQIVVTAFCFVVPARKAFCLANHGLRPSGLRSLPKSHLSSEASLTLLFKEHPLTDQPPTPTAALSHLFELWYNTPNTKFVF